jgi:putative permease
MSNHPIVNWLNRYLGRPEILALFAVLLGVYSVFVFFGQMLMPVFVSIVIAYLLQGLVHQLERLKCPHFIAVLLVFFVFVGAVVVAMFFLVPVLWHQLNNLIMQMPKMIAHAQHVFQIVHDRYPQLIASAEFQQTLISVKSETFAYGQKLLSFSLASLSNLVVISIYFILVPLLVYFFLMDKKQLLSGFQQYLPRRRQVLSHVWHEVYDQIGFYVRGKVMEALIIGVVFFVFFLFMGLDYASLLAVLVGVSVIIPYVGAVLVTVPIFVVALLQWNLTAHFGYFVIMYTILTAVDGNVLVPLIFSEAVDLHPVSIILAILIFGGLFGFWGVFFAIPLASVTKAVARALAELEA